MDAYFVSWKIGWDRISADCRQQGETISVGFKISQRIPNTEYEIVHIKQRMMNRNIINRMGFEYIRIIKKRSLETKLGSNSGFFWEPATEGGNPESGSGAGWDEMRAGGSTPHSDRE